MPLSDRAFGLTFGAVFLVIAAVGWLAFDARPYWAVAVAAVFLTTAVAIPWVLLPLNRLWAVIAHRVSLVVNHLVLGIFFYTLVFPLGRIIRLLGRDPMHRALDSTATSYLTPVERHTDAETFSDMF